MSNTTGMFMIHIQLLPLEFLIIVIYRQGTRMMGRVIQDLAK
jgi:hypothetical protein